MATDLTPYPPLLRGEGEPEPEHWPLNAASGLNAALGHD